MVHDTLDLVIVGFYNNEYYLACYDNDMYIVVAIIKQDELQDCIIHKTKIKNYRVVCSFSDNNFEFVYPSCVVEVSMEKIVSSGSEKYPFFLVNPVFIKVRYDKNPEHATTLHEVQSLYKMQINK